MSFWTDLRNETLQTLAAPAPARLSSGPQQMLQRLYPGGYQTPPKRGTKELLLGYSSMPWLRAVSSKIAHIVASTEWVVLSPSRGKRSAPDRVAKILGMHDIVRRSNEVDSALEAGDLTQLTDHPLLLLVRASRSVTAHALWKLTSIHYDLVGEAYWALERTRSKAAVEPWPVPPHWVIGLPTPSTPFYRVSYRGFIQDIPAADMLVFRDPDPENPYGRGSGIAMSLGDELDTDEYTSKFMKQFFLNSARPDVLISFEGAGEDQVKAAEARWNQLHRGVWRAFKTYFTNAKLNVHEFQTNFRNLQMVPLRQFERDTVINVYGMPPEKFGILNASNRSTIDAADLIMTKDVAVPRLDAYRSQLQQFADLEYGEGSIVVHYRSPVREDQEFHLKAAATMPDTVSWDDWRRLQGLPPSEDKELGKRVVMRTGVTIVDPIEKMNEPPPQLALPGATPFSGGGEHGPEDAKPPKVQPEPAGSGPVANPQTSPKKELTNGHTPWNLSLLTDEELRTVEALARKAANGHAG